MKSSSINGFMKLSTCKNNSSIQELLQWNQHFDIREEEFEKTTTKKIKRYVELLSMNISNLANKVNISNLANKLKLK